MGRCRDVVDCASYNQYIAIIKERLTRDLKRAYPEAEIDSTNGSIKKGKNGMLGVRYRKWYGDYKQSV